MEVLKNRTMKSKKTDDFQLQISEKDEPKPTFDLKETDKIPKIVNINRIEMKFKQILREIRQKLLLKEFQKTKTRTIGFMNDFTMEILEKKSNSVVIFYPFLQLFNKKIIKLLQSISRILIRWFIVWRIFYFFFVIFMGFMISLEYFFKAPTNLSECSLIPISLILLTLNIFLEKIIFQKQKTDQSYQKITINYVKSNFLLDLISYLILVMNLANILSIKNFWSLLYLLQLHNYQPLQLYILKKTIFSSNFKQITVLVFLLIKTVVLSHFLACATYYFSSELSSEMFTWDIKYLSSLNDSLSLLFLINNENLKLITNKSLGFSYITTIVSAFWFLYIIKIFFIAFQTSQTPSSSDSNETLMRFDKNQYQNLLNCMIRLKMRKDLIINVRNYLDDIDHETGKALINLGNNQAFNKLSPNLKEAILASSQNKVFGTVPMLYRNFSEEFLRNLIPKMVLAHYNPENIIYNVMIL